MKNMKNFLVVDGAKNSTYDVYSVGEDLFSIVFPNETDVAFLDELVRRVRLLGMDEADFCNKLYSNPVGKKDISGLHGVLHSTGSYCEKAYFPNRMESDVKK